MTIETLTTLKVSFFVLGFIIFLLIETYHPNREWNTPRYKRLLFHSVIAVFNTALMRIPIIFILMPVLILITESQYGLLFIITEQNSIKFLLSFIILDLSLYWWHRLNHTNQFLWKFHYVHHVDTHMDVGTSVRFHIGELILSTIYKAVIIYIFGITLAEYLFYEILLVLSIQFHHSNILLPSKVEKVLSRILVTPIYHTNHHTTARSSREANYSSILTIWDKLFLSYVDAKDEERLHMGLENREIELKLIENIMYPFKKNVDR
jgi:sterol desaturase/sphingolipid hydroxylase (fatty acid hydroxylase superfamily)